MVRQFLPAVLLLVVVAVLPASAELDPNHWRWSNPLPHGNSVLDMYLAPGFVVQVGDRGTVYLHYEEGRWAPAVTGTSNYLRGVTMLGTRFLVSGENGCLMWSDDGKIFQHAQLSPPTTDWFEGVTANMQRAVAVGDNGSIYISTNGTYWTKASSETTEWLRGVAVGGGGFVAVGENGTILRSAGGNSWSRITSGTTSHLNRVRYLGNGMVGQYYAVGNGGVMLSSSSGSSGWAPISTGTTNHLYDVTANDTGLLLVGDQEVRFRSTGSTEWRWQADNAASNAAPAWVYLSAGGRTNYFHIAGRSGLILEGWGTDSGTNYSWQPASDSSYAWLWDLTIANGTYVAAGDLATILTSLDGVLWARELMPAAWTNTVLLGVGGTTNNLLAAGSGGTVLISRAGVTNLSITNIIGTNIIVTNATFNTLGLIWTNVPAFTSNTLQGVAASSNLYVVCGENGRLFSSPDGSNWTARITPTTNFLSGVAYGPETWIAVGDQGTLLRAGPTADDWERVAMNTTNWLYRVRWVGNKFVVVGQNGALYTSAAGTTWAQRESGTTRRLNDVTYVDDTWYVVGHQGVLLAATNVASWRPVPVPTLKSLFAAANWDGQLLVAGVEGAILRNQVVPRQTPVNFLGYNSSTVMEPVLVGTNTQQVATTYELFLFGGQTDQWFQFQSAAAISPSAWNTNAVLEVFDPSGTLYLLRTRDQTNTLSNEFYRTRLVP